MLDIESKQNLYRKIERGLREKYSEVPDIFIKQRVNEEWLWFQHSNALSVIALLNDITCRLKSMGISYSPRYFCNASFLLYILDVTKVNPLPPHYYCPKCHSVIWDNFNKCGLDLEKDRLCKNEGSVLQRGGFAIPWETGFLNRECCFNISLEVRDFDEVIKVLEEFDVKYSATEYQIIETNNIVFWFNLSDKIKSLGFTFDAFNLENSLSKIRQYAQKVTPELKLEINSFADIIAYMGILRSSYVDDSKLKVLINTSNYKPSEILSCREDLYKYCLGYGLEKIDAVRVMEFIRKGKYKSPNFPVDVMHKVKDKWLVSLCEDILYLPSKTEIIEDLLLASANPL